MNKLTNKWTLSMLQEEIPNSTWRPLICTSGNELMNTNNFNHRIKCTALSIHELIYIHQQRHMPIAKEKERGIGQCCRTNNLFFQEITVHSNWHGKIEPNVVRESIGGSSMGCLYATDCSLMGSACMQSTPSLQPTSPLDQCTKIPNVLNKSFTANPLGPEYCRLIFLTTPLNKVSFFRGTLQMKSPEL